MYSVSLPFVSYFSLITPFPHHFSTHPGFWINICCITGKSNTVEGTVVVTVGKKRVKPHIALLLCSCLAETWVPGFEPKTELRSCFGHM